MQQVKIADLILDHEIQIRHRINDAAVQRYVDANGLLPPIDIFKLPDDAMLVADGWHRIKAAGQRGEDTIYATIHKGTRKDAEAFAIVANCKHGLPLSREERDEGIARLHTLKWSGRKIAAEMSVSEALVRDVVASLVVGAIEDEVLRISAQPKTAKKQRLTTDDRIAIAKAPATKQRALVKAALKGGWTAKETEQAVANQSDPRVPKNVKDRELKGEPPVRYDDKGEPAILGDTVRRVMAEPGKFSAACAYGRFAVAMSSFMHWTPKQVVTSTIEMDDACRADRLKPDEHNDLNSLINDLPEMIAHLQAVLDEALSRKGALRVVKGGKE